MDKIFGGRETQTEPAEVRLKGIDEEGWKVRKRRKGRDTKIISDPETEKLLMDTQRERGRDSHGYTHIDMERETEMTGNCGPGPTRAPGKAGHGGSQQHGLLPRMVRAYNCHPELITLQGRGLWGRAPSDSGDHSLSNMWPQGSNQELTSLQPLPTGEEALGSCSEHLTGVQSCLVGKKLQAPFFLST